MNFREGIRRVFLVFAWFLAIATFVGVAANTPKEPPGYEWEQKIKDAAQLDFDPSGKFALQWGSSDYGTSFVVKSCEQPKPATVLAVCQAYSEAKGNMLWTQVQHIAIGLAAAFAVLLIVFGLWRLLDWILAGFGQRHATEPR